MVQRLRELQVQLGERANQERSPKRRTPSCEGSPSGTPPPQAAQSHPARKEVSGSATTSSDCLTSSVPKEDTVSSSKAKVTITTETVDNSVAAALLAQQLPPLPEVLWGGHRQRAIPGVAVTIPNDC